MRTETAIERIRGRALASVMPFSLILFVAASFSGCGTKPAFPGAHLAGAVNINGQPVEKGTIAFTPTGSARGKAVGVPIAAGRYDCPYVPLGDSLVQIYALRPTGKMIEVMGAQTPEMEDVVPKKDRDGIKIEVTTDKLDQDFALTSSDEKSLAK